MPCLWHSRSPVLGISLTLILLALDQYLALADQYLASLMQLSCMALLACPSMTCFVVGMQRDIPMPLVSSGVEKGNLRELALARMGDLGLHCRDVRTREAGIQDIHHKVTYCTPLPSVLVAVGCVGN